MKVNFELTTQEKTDVKILGVLGMFLSYGLPMVMSGVEPKMPESKEENREHPEPAAEPNSNVVENPADEAPAAEEKPKAKRVRKKKDAEPAETPAAAPAEPVDVEAPTAEETAAAMEAEAPAEEPVEEAPAEEPVEVKVAPMINKCSVEEWREILKQKSCEIGIAKMVKTGNTTDIVEGPLAAMKPAFNDYIHNLSAEFGNRIPSKLDDETRYSFVEKFKRICYNPETKGFEIDGAPF